MALAIITIMLKRLKDPALFPLFLVLYELSTYLSNDAYLPALPTISQHLAISHDTAQLSLSVFFLGNALMQLIMGPIADRLGRRPVMLIGGGVFVSATFVLAMATSAPVLLIGRFFEGCAIAPMVVTGYATIHALLDQKKAIKTIAWMNSISVLAPAFGPLFGAVILLFFSWRMIFIILGVWSALCLYGIVLGMPETLKEKLSFSPKRIAKDYIQVVTNWQFLQPTLCIGLIFAIMLAWITDGPFLVLERFHQSPVVFGLMQIIIFGTLIIGTKCVPFLLEKLSLRQMINLSISIVTSACVLALVLTYVTPDKLYDVVIPLSLIAFSSGISFPVFNRLAVESKQGTLAIKMSLFSSFIAMSGFIGSLLITLFHQGGATDFAHIISGLGLSTIVLYFPWRQTNDKSA